MDNMDWAVLAAVRIDRAKELLNEAEDLLQKGSFKSANNRAFYAMEKALNALLALRKVGSATHAGILKQFNILYIHEGDGYFTHDDYQQVADASQIRSASDYDDFYIASKEESTRQVRNAAELIHKVDLYMNEIR